MTYLGVIGVVGCVAVTVVFLWECLAFYSFIGRFSNIITKDKIGELYKGIGGDKYIDTTKYYKFIFGRHIFLQKEFSIFFSYSGIGHANSKYGILRWSLADKVVKLKIEQLKRIHEKHQ